MNDDVLVKVEGVSKKFCRSLKRSLWYGVQDVASEMFSREGHHDANTLYGARTNSGRFKIRKGCSVRMFSNPQTVGPSGSIELQRSYKLED